MAPIGHQFAGLDLRNWTCEATGRYFPLFKKKVSSSRQARIDAFHEYACSQSILMSHKVFGNQVNAGKTSLEKVGIEKSLESGR